MKLIRQFFRYIRDGFKNIWNNLFMSLSSVITLTLTLSLCSLFVLFAHNTSNFTEQVESEIKIFVEFSKEATQEQIAAAIDLMKSQEHVADIIHTTKEEEYTDFINRIGEDDPELATFFENTSDENPLRDSVVVAADDVKNVDEVAKVVKEIDGVDYIFVTDEQYDNLRNIIKKMEERINPYRFNILGLILVGFNIKYEMEDHFYCAEFLKYLFEECNIENNLPRLVAPDDFKNLKGIKYIYKGKLSEYRENTTEIYSLDLVRKLKEVNATKQVM